MHSVKMPKIFKASLTVLAVACLQFNFHCNSALAQTNAIGAGEKDTIFIGPVKVRDSVTELLEKQRKSIVLKRAQDVLQSELTAAFNKTRVFQLVERERADAVQLEQAFSAVNVDSSDKNKANMAQFAGAKFAVLPEINSFEDQTSVTEYERIGRKDISRKLSVSVVLKIVNTTTGAILPESPSVQLSTKDAAEYARMGASVATDDQVTQLMMLAAHKLSWAVVGQVRPPKILSVTGNEVMINRGSDAGFVSGSKVEIFAFNEVKDEDSGEVFRNEVSVGKASITRALPNQSWAALDTKENLGVTKGCIVRPAEVKKAKAAKKVREEESPGSSEKPIDFQ